MQTNCQKIKLKLENSFKKHTKNTCLGSPHKNVQFLDSRSNSDTPCQLGPIQSIYWVPQFFGCEFFTCLDYSFVHKWGCSGSTDLCHTLSRKLRRYIEIPAPMQGTRSHFVKELKVKILFYISYQIFWGSTSSLLTSSFAPFGCEIHTEIPSLEEVWRNSVDHIWDIK